MKAFFVTNCVSSTSAAITPMVDKARDISRETFLKYVDRNNLREIERSLGYDAHPKQGLTMAGDFHVSYHRSVFKGRPCVFFRWSAIEYVFVADSTTPGNACLCGAPIELDQTSCGDCVCSPDPEPLVTVNLQLEEGDTCPF